MSQRKMHRKDKMQQKTFDKFSDMLCKDADDYNVAVNRGKRKFLGKRKTFAKSQFTDNSSDSNISEKENRMNFPNKSIKRIHVEIPDKWENLLENDSQFSDSSSPKSANKAEFNSNSDNFFNTASIVDNKSIEKLTQCSATQQNDNVSGINQKTLGNEDGIVRIKPDQKVSDSIMDDNVTFEKEFIENGANQFDFDSLDDFESNQKEDYTCIDMEIEDFDDPPLFEMLENDIDTFENGMEHSEDINIEQQMYPSEPDVLQDISNDYIHTDFHKRSSENNTGDMLIPHNDSSIIFAIPGVKTVNRSKISIETEIPTNNDNCQITDNNGTSPGGNQHVTDIINYHNEKLKHFTTINGIESNHVTHQSQNVDEQHITEDSLATSDNSVNFDNMNTKSNDTQTDITKILANRIQYIKKHLSIHRIENTNGKIENQEVNLTDTTTHFEDNFVNFLTRLGSMKSSTDDHSEFVKQQISTNDHQNIIKNVILKNLLEKSEKIESFNNTDDKNIDNESVDLNQQSQQYSFSSDVKQYNRDDLVNSINRSTKFSENDDQCITMNETDKSNEASNIVTESVILKSITKEHITKLVNNYERLSKSSNLDKFSGFSNNLKGNNDDEITRFHKISRSISSDIVINNKKQINFKSLPDILDDKYLLGRNVTDNIEIEVQALLMTNKFQKMSDESIDLSDYDKFVQYKDTSESEDSDSLSSEERSDTERHVNDKVIPDGIEEVHHNYRLNNLHKNISSEELLSTSVKAQMDDLSIQTLVLHDSKDVTPRMTSDNAEYMFVFQYDFKSVILLIFLIFVHFVTILGSCYTFFNLTQNSAHKFY